MPVDRIDNLPAGTQLFLDANIFIYAFLGHSDQCRDLLTRCATEQVFGITILDVVNEAPRVRSWILLCPEKRLLDPKGEGR